MSNDDDEWYLLDDGEEESLQVSHKRDHKIFDDMPPPNAIVKKMRADDDVVDLISDSDDSDGDEIMVDNSTNDDVVPMSTSSSVARNNSNSSSNSNKDKIVTTTKFNQDYTVHNNENIMNGSGAPTLSLAQRLLAKVAALGPIQPAMSSNTSSSSNISLSAAVIHRPPLNATTDRSDTFSLAEVGTRSVPNSQTSSVPTSSSITNRIVFNTYCPSHDPSKHGRAIVDISDDNNDLSGGSSSSLPPSQQQQSQSQSQSQSQLEETLADASPDAESSSSSSLHRVLTVEQLQTWVVVLLVDQREKEHAFQQAKLLVCI